MRSAIQEARKAVEEKNPEKAKSSLLMASKKIDKACSSGIVHWKTASRKVSRLAKLVNKLSAS
jgi:small subunit ribosomal protein S20